MGRTESNDESRQTLKDMLSLTKERQAPLSTVVLNGLIEGHSGLGSGKEIDWNLISLILEIDGDVFSEEDKAAILFSEITRVVGVLNETNTPGPELRESPVQGIDTREKIDRLFPHANHCSSDESLRKSTDA